jgi:hypothetical protein
MVVQTSALSGTFGNQPPRSSGRAKAVRVCARDSNFFVHAAQIQRMTMPGDTQQASRSQSLAGAGSGGRRWSLGRMCYVLALGADRASLASAERINGEPTTETAKALRTLRAWWQRSLLTIQKVQCRTIATFHAATEWAGELRRRWFARCAGFSGLIRLRLHRVLHPSAGQGFVVKTQLAGA